MKRRVMYAVSAALFVVLLGIRIYQIFFRMDTTTGIFVGSDVSMTLFDILMILIIVWVFFTTLSKKTEKMLVYPVFEPDMALSAFRKAGALLAGAGFLLYAVGQVSVLMSTNPIPVSALVLAAFAVLSALFFFLVFIREGGKGEKLPLTVFSIAPVLFFTVRLIVLYMSYSSIADISSYIPEMFSLIFSTLFWLYFAYGVGGVGSLKKMARFGILGTGFTVLWLVSSVLIRVKAENVPFTFAFGMEALSNLFLVFYIIAFLLTRAEKIVPMLSSLHAEAAKKSTNS